MAALLLLSPLGDRSPPPTVKIMSVRTGLGAKWYLLLFCCKCALKFDLKAATSSDELTFFNAHMEQRQQVAIMQSSHILDKECKRMIYICGFCMCHSTEVFNTMYKLQSFLD